ncbi:MAG: hypothetical protein AAFX06_31585 [Planctomycetota bacterium]
MSKDPFALNAPDATAPQLSALRASVRSRRKRRYTRNGGILFAVVLGLFSVQQFSTEPPLTVDHSVATHRQKSVQLETETDSGPFPHAVDQPPFRLFAEVNATLPVFTFDEERDEMVPLGWVQASDVMPVDLGNLSAEQTALFESVLHNDPKPQFISL